MIVRLAFVAGALWALPAIADPADGLVRVGYTTPAISYGNPYSRDEGSGLRNAIFDALTLVERDGALKPALAERWRVVDPTTWEFSIRPGVAFSNGEPFDAAAAAENLNVLMAPEALGTLPRAAELAGVAAVEAVDGLTLRIRTKAPDPLLARRLNMLAMVPPKAWKTMGVDAFARAPVGTGPYRLAAWVEDNKRVRLAASPSSWRPVADAKAVEVVVLSDPSARIKALLSGQLDIVAGLGPDDLDAVRAAGFEAVVIGGNSVMSIAFRTVRDDDAPLKDLRVRQALNYAVDKQGIVDAIMLGTTRVASQGVAFGMPGHNPRLAPVPYDPAKAKAMLAEAGYPSGFPLTIAVYGGLLPNDSLIFQKLAQDLGAVGIKVELRPMVFADYVRRLFAGDWQGIDAFSNGWLGAGLGDPIRSIDQFSCRFSAPFFCDESVLPAIDATRTEMDPARREALMHTVMAELNRVGVALWLVEFSAIYGVSPRVADFDTRDVGVKFEELTFKH